MSELYNLRLPDKQEMILKHWNEDGLLLRIGTDVFWFYAWIDINYVDQLIQGLQRIRKILEEKE